MSRLRLISTAEFAVPAAAPERLPYAGAHNDRRANYWTYDVNFGNIHLHVEAASAWNDPMVASIVTLWGYAQLADGTYLPPAKIFQGTITDSLPVDVEVPGNGYNPLGFNVLYLQNDGGTAVKATILCEGKVSTGGANNVY